jgi:hypothetical protein
MVNAMSRVLSSSQSTVLCELFTSRVASETVSARCTVLGSLIKWLSAQLAESNICAHGCTNQSNKLKPNVVMLHKQAAPH